MRRYAFWGALAAVALLFVACGFFEGLLGGAQAGPSEPSPDKGTELGRRVGEVAEGLHPLVPFIAGILSGILGDRGQKKGLEILKARKARNGKG